MSIPVVETMTWAMRARQLLKALTWNNVYRAKRIAFGHRRERQSMYLLHRAVNHVVRDLVWDLDMIVRTVDSPDGLRARIERETTKVLATVCDRFSSFIGKQVPGTCSTCVKIVVSQDDVRTSSFYEKALQRCNGDELAIAEQMGGNFSEDSTALMALTRARCGESHHTRQDLIGFCFQQASSAFEFFTPDAPTVHGLPKLVYCPSYDLWLREATIRKMTTGDIAPYRNPTQRYWRLYRAAAVFPIRLNGFAATALGGYLCVDSTHPYAFSPLLTVADKAEECSAMVNFGLAISDACGTALAAEVLANDAINGSLSTINPHVECE